MGQPQITAQTNTTRHAITDSHPTAEVGMPGRSTKALNLTSLIQLVLHSGPQYQGIQYDHAAALKKEPHNTNEL
jgi:hypothetical protein